MDGQMGLGSGTRVAILGGGISGTATAAALLFAARARGREIDVHLYQGDRDPSAHRPPVVLSPECRSRLAALGCRLSPEWRAVILRGIEVISGRARELLEGPQGGLWVVDAWPDGLAGRVQVAQALAAVATQHGARMVPRRVDRVEPAGRRFCDPAPQSGPGGWVVWAHGANERAHAVVLAAGAAPDLGARFGDRFLGAPTVCAAEARLCFTPEVHAPWTVGKLLLAPMEGVDALYLLPCRGSIYALALGPAVQPADLCQALMIAARDGHLGDGFEIAHLGPTRVPAGVGRALCGNGQLAVGPAAIGHPLQLTLAETLASCSRAAVALVDAGGDGRLLTRRYVREGIDDLAEDARTATQALRALLRAKDRAVEAFRRARARGGLHPGAGVVGLSSPHARALRTQARIAAFKESVGRWWRFALEPIPPAHPEIEPSLFYVVDDDPIVRSGVAEMLEARGAEVVSFSSELALFSAVARRPPQAVLLDVVLSWVDGLRLCEELKRHPLTREVPVVVMSGLSRPWVRERALRAGAQAFLAKPITPEQLFEVLRTPVQRPSRGYAHGAVV
ncbi:MAG: response regulator [Myxococcaceae bacterium]|nr:response regulator [Myxococcaceae bacterium]